MSCSVDKFASMVFFSKLKPSSSSCQSCCMRVLKIARPWITSSLWKVNNLRIPSPCPLPAPNHACIGINLLGEGGSFAGGGGRPPPPASIFPLTSVVWAFFIWNKPLGRGIKGVGIATMFWDRYKLSNSKTDNLGILNALFRANSLHVFSITQYTSCVHFVALNPNYDIPFLLL